MDDLTKLNDTEFEALKAAVNVERQRRDTLARSADQIRELVGSYVDAGGSIDDLALEPPEPVVAPEILEPGPVSEGGDGDAPDAGTSLTGDGTATIQP